MDLDTTSGRELGDYYRVRNLSEDGRVGLSAQPIVERMEISRSDDELEMSGLANCQSRAQTECNKILTSLESNVNGSGARFGLLQNGWPVFVTASLGRLNSN